MTMKTLNSIPICTPMFFRPQLDGRCLVFGILKSTPPELKSDAVVAGTMIPEEYRDAPEMAGKSYPAVISEGWKGIGSLQSSHD